MLAPTLVFPTIMRLPSQCETWPECLPLSKLTEGCESNEGPAVSGYAAWAGTVSLYMLAASGGAIACARPIYPQELQKTDWDVRMPMESSLEPTC